MFIACRALGDAYSNQYLQQCLTNTCENDGNCNEMFTNCDCPAGYFGPICHMNSSTISIIYSRVNNLISFVPLLDSLLL